MDSVLIYISLPIYADRWAYLRGREVMPVPLHMPVSRGKIMPEKGGGRIDESGMEEGEYIYIHYAFYREFGCTGSIAENDGIDRENCA